MRKITLLLALFITTFSFAQVQIGNGTDQAQNMPFDPYWRYSYTQSIYTAAEISATAGNITGLQWYYSGPTVGSVTNNLTIYMGNTTKASFSGNTDWVAVGTLTPVFTGSLVVAGEGFVSITFDTPFAYNGTDNLIIAVDENQNETTLLGSTEDFYNTAVSSGRSLAYRSDTNNPDPVTPPTASTTPRFFVPNIILDGISSSTPPGCTTLIQSTLINPNGNINWNVATNSPTGYAISIGSTSGSSDILVPANVMTNSYNLSALALANNTTYYMSLVPYNGAGSATGCSELTFTTRPVSVANDLCSGATSIAHQTQTANAASATPTGGTVINAFDSNTAATNCNAFTGDANDDVWYSFVAQTSDATITYELNFDGVATLYSGSCGSLVYVACADNTVTTAPIVEQIVATGLTPGNTYYTRIYSYGITAPTNGTFNVKIWTPNMSTLGIDDSVIENSLSYFPNPVKNTLTLRAQNNIQNVSVFNMLGQEVLRTAPNTIVDEVNMSSLLAGAYIVKVTINDITKTIRVIKQ